MLKKIEIENFHQSFDWENNECKLHWIHILNYYRREKVLDLEIDPPITNTYNRMRNVQENKLQSFSLSPIQFLFIQLNIHPLSRILTAYPQTTGRTSKLPSNDPLQHASQIYSNRLYLSDFYFKRKCYFRNS